MLCGGDLLGLFALPGLWEDEDIEAIAGDYGIVVITRAGSQPHQFIDKHPLLTKHKGNIDIGAIGAKEMQDETVKKENPVWLDHETSLVSQDHNYFLTL